MSEPAQVVVCGGFDDIRSRQLRFLQEAARFGELTVLLWPDEVLKAQTGQPPEFPFAERLYFLNAVRYVTRVLPAELCPGTAALPRLDGLKPRVWVDEQCAAAGAGILPAGPGALKHAGRDAGAPSARREFSRKQGIEYRVLPLEQMRGFPEPPPMPSPPGRKKVVVTGCYDWFHSGHVRFTEEVSAYGDLYVIVGHDANIRLLKGAGHPLFPQEERRYVVGSIKYVKQALIATGDGWLDADPDIQRLKPDIYAVNEDGDKGGKREYCAQRGLQYLVLQRTPAPGLTRRSSTSLRGF